MHVGLVHSFHSEDTPSGENIVVRSEQAALERAGFRVTLAALDSDEERRGAGILRAARTVATGHGPAPLELLEDPTVDLIHVHNLFPHWGSDWLADTTTPIVATVHNYRALCSNGLLFRDGGHCQDCVDGSSWNAVRHRCYRSSRIATLPVAWGNRGSVAANPLLARADRVVFVSEPARRRHLAAALPPERTTVVENFVPDAFRELGTSRVDNERSGWVVAGRLVPHKGMQRLVEHWPDGERLTILGDGPDLGRLRDLSIGQDVHVVGRVAREDVLAAMACAEGVLMPSLWPEAFPLTTLEALACGTPVLAFDTNVVADIVRQHRVGRVMSWQDDLATTLAECRAAFPALR